MSESTSRYERMTYHRAGSSGLKLPMVSLGGWHNFEDPALARVLALKAFDLGITHLDFANNYGPPPGKAEYSLGEVLAHDLAAHRDELIISTKAGYHMWEGPYGQWGSRKYLLASLDQSLQRMGIPYVDVFYSHRFDPETPLEETIGALDQAVRSGRALYAGISNYPAEAVTRAARIAKQLNLPLVLHQCVYSMLKRGLEGKVLKKTSRKGMGMIVFSPLAQGLLTDRYLDGIPEDSRAAGKVGFLKRHNVTPELIERLRSLQEIAASCDLTLAQMALLWCLRDSRITSVLIGASKPEQIEDCAAIAEKEPLESAVLDQIERILMEPAALS